jgi:hypothetical protein
VDLEQFPSKCHDFLWVGSCILFIIMRILDVIHLGKDILVNMHHLLGLKAFVYSVLYLCFKISW